MMITNQPSGNLSYWKSSSASVVIALGVPLRVLQAQIEALNSLLITLLQMIIDFVHLAIAYSGASSPSSFRLATSRRSSSKLDLHPEVHSGRQSPTFNKSKSDNALDTDRYLNAQQLTYIEHISSRALARKLLIIDLDETLIHTSNRSSLYSCRPPQKMQPAFRLEVPFPSHPIPVLYYVYKRPHAIRFLRTVAQWFDIAIYTASVRQYGNLVIDVLQREAGIDISPELRFFREHCIPTSTQSLQSSHRFSLSTDSLVRSSSRHSFSMGVSALDTPVAPVAPSAHMFSKNVALVARRWLSLRKMRRFSRRRRRTDFDTASSDASTDVDEDEVERALGRVILMDNSNHSFMLQPLNGLPILQWINDPSDTMLLDILPVLDALRFVLDVRSVLGLRVFDDFVKRME
eukprot:Partr_v1_DN25757_c0_g1_i1_m74962 putative CTD (Carboxy-terminal domain, RNA polymerase II, polypeptide A) small